MFLYKIQWCTKTLWSKHCGENLMFYYYLGNTFWTSPFSFWYGGNRWYQAVGVKACITTITQ